ncbi:MAG: prolipoprotein diacylglyceryl transferase [Anaerolineaceae bacterium]|nr:prolipoprotein diacylglyceryl transferase [Anaerolineaceae bacterium]
MDPVIFSFDIGNFTFALRWYGVLVMTGILVGAWLSSKELERRKSDPEIIWDVLLVLVIAGIIGARLWYVANAILGGNTYYLQNPLQIINIPQGGLHYFGGMLFGAIALIFYCRKRGLDLWLLTDSIAPGLLIGQAIARPANFINQELYGQPTLLPWGIPIDRAHRLPMYSDMSLFPDSVRFHPTFAYEILWNVFAMLLLLWIARQYKNKLRPGVIFAGWLVLAGFGRVIIETWRPDQPLIPGTAISYTRLVSGLMFLTGVLMILFFYEVIRVKFLGKPQQAYNLPEPQETVEEAQAAE